jgi:hypothetical protein
MCTQKIELFSSPNVLNPQPKCNFNDWSHAYLQILNEHHNEIKLQVIRKWVVKTERYVFYHIQFNVIDEMERKFYELNRELNYDNLELVDLTVPEWLWKIANPLKTQIFTISERDMSDPKNKYCKVKIDDLGDTKIKDCHFYIL